MHSKAFVLLFKAGGDGRKLSVVVFKGRMVTPPDVLYSV